MSECIAELVLKFDLNDKESRHKFDAVLNSYNYKNFIVELKKYVDESHDCDVDAFSNKFYLLAEKHGIL